MRRLGLSLLVLALVGGAAAAAVVLLDTGTTSPGGDQRTPVLGSGGDEEAAATGLGFPGFATKNTVRVAGSDAVANAAAVAQAVYPARGDDTRPQAVVLADAADWQAAISAAQLMAPPIRAPILFSDGDELPAATEDALEQLAPTGSEQLEAQVIRIGDVPEPDGLETADVEPGEPAEVAARIHALVGDDAAGGTGGVVVASVDEPEYAMPAASWAAKSGDPVLWVTRDAVPAATRRALEEQDDPHVYVLGPPSVISDPVLEALGEVAEEVVRIDQVAVGRSPARQVRDPVESAIAFARFYDEDFDWGWRIREPGHGLAFVSARRTLDAAAAAPLSSSGQYAPLLLVPEAAVFPAILQEYLLDIQPGYAEDPRFGVYSYGWIVGDESAVSVDVQARIDSLLEIVPQDLGEEDESDEQEGEVEPDDVED
jgi:DNA-directed RNA polymerase subunit K/omega